jgi:hypothetical protein
VTVDEIRPLHVTPNRGMGHQAAMQVSLVLYPTSWVKEEFTRPLSKFQLTELEARRIARCLRTHEGIAFDPNEETLILRPPIDRVAFGRGEWQGTTPIKDDGRDGGLSVPFRVGLYVACYPPATQRGSERCAHNGPTVTQN